MKPEICKVKNDPPNSYGDCVRACVASLLERDDVPHFYEDGNGQAAFVRMREYLSQHGLIPAYFDLSGEATLHDILETVKETYGNVEFLLFCRNRSGDHCVIGRGNEIVHDPAWYRTEIVGPHSMGVWIVILLARIC